MSNNYRKIWGEYNQQEIPKGYHIHHIDGNHDNNNPQNLECLSAEDHWKKHYEQGDIVALNGKFIQGASAAGKRGGSAGKGKTKDQSNGKLSKSLKQSYIKRGGSPLKGRNLNPEHIDKIKSAVHGENNPMFGKAHSDESKELMSLNRPDYNGTNNPMFGRTHSDETKQKISDKAKGRESKMKGRINESVRSKKYKWYNDGIKSFKMPEGTQPKNYKLGRIKIWKK